MADHQAGAAGLIGLPGTFVEVESETVPHFATSGIGDAQDPAVQILNYPFPVHSQSQDGGA